MGSSQMGINRKSRRLAGKLKSAPALAHVLELAKIIEADLRTSARIPSCLLARDIAQEAIADAFIWDAAQPVFHVQKFLTNVLARHRQLEREQAGKPPDSPSQIQRITRPITAMPFQGDEEVGVLTSPTLQGDS